MDKSLTPEISESALSGHPVIPDAASSGLRQSILQRVGALLGARAMVPVWLAAILLFGASLRFTGINWDEGQHLHPDERFLSDVLGTIQWPESNFLQSYFDEANSTLNPRNVGKTFWVYGDFPIIFAKGVGVLMDQVVPRTDGGSWHSYGYGNLMGRVLDGIMDLGTLLMLFVLARRLYKDHRVALLAALLYAGTALAIQQSHFFVVDPFTTFFVTVALYFMVRVFQEGKALDYLFAGAFVGIALATKVSVFTLALVVALVGLYRFYVESKTESRELVFYRVTSRLLLSGFAALLMFRFFQPYAFSGFFSIAPRWWANAQEARTWVTGMRDAPFAHQWTNRTILWFPWQNMVLWGMGLPLGLTAWVGWGAALWQLLRRQRWIHLVPVAWIGILFLHQGTQWVKSLRYFLPIYPMLVLMAAWLLVALWDQARRTSASALPSNSGFFTWTPLKAALLVLLVTIPTLIYAYGFTSIYMRPHTRVEASRWIYENVPPGSVVANETVWDDGLPLRLPDAPAPESMFVTSVAMPYGTNTANLTEEQLRQLTDSLSTTLNITDEDEIGKWYGRSVTNEILTPGILDKLDQIDYYFISSNRQYDSMARLPMRFPAVINFYDALFSGELGFEKVAEFTSYPHFLGIPLPDQGAEEAWHVYDHNRVMIFRKTDTYSREKAEALILGDVQWENVEQLWPKDVAGWAGTLQFARGDRALYEENGSWYRIFDRASFANRVPLFVWVVLLQVLGLLALPYLLVVSTGLPTRGFAFAKPLGLLLVGWLVWIAASLRFAPFTVPTILLMMALVAVGGLLLLHFAARERRQAFPVFVSGLVRRHWKPFLAAEALFWLFFLLVLVVRWANPDLWHPDLGGEKPMDFAFLNAVIKSVYFPPMDPWFAGGYINYYYFGFVLVATIIKLSGIVPEVAYNLIIPTFFAMLAVGVWGAALALLTPLHTSNDEGQGQDAALPTVWPFALLAALMVTVLGNLGELKVLWEGLPQLSTWTFQSALPGVEKAVHALNGLWRMVTEGLTLPGRMEWPYWNATRAIPDTINEFPWFTFLYADLHAHLMALPYTLLTIGLSLAFLRAPLTEARWREAGRLFLLALVLGALWPTNTWDFPTYALVAFAGLGLREWWRDGRITTRGVVSVTWRWFLVLLLSYLLFQPFHAHYGSAYSSVERWRGERTVFGDFLIVHGLFLFLIVFALVNDWRYGRGHNAVVRTLRYQIRHLGRRGRASRLYERFVRPAPIVAVLVNGLVGVAILSMAVSVAGWAVPGFLLLLLAVSLFLFFRTRPEPRQQMILFFIILGLGLALAVEFVVLKGDIGRMNTVFKFYLQIWVLWGIAAAVGVASVQPHLPRWLPAWRTVWRFGFASLFAVALLYPIFATHAKINDRFDRSVGPTLNGAAFMEKAIYHDDVRYEGTVVPLELKWDADAIRWFQENVPGSPTIVEMNTYPRLYGWGNRYAMWTGNPAVIGWDWHERQQRAAARSDDEVYQRINDVTVNIYNTPDAELAHSTMLRYGADYLVVGALERAYAPPEGIAKFEAQQGVLWDLVYANPEVQIYRIREAEGS